MDATSMEIIDFCDIFQKDLYMFKHPGSANFDPDIQIMILPKVIRSSNISKLIKQNNTCIVQFYMNSDKHVLVDVFFNVHGSNIQKEFTFDTKFNLHLDRIHILLNSNIGDVNDLDKLIHDFDLG